MNILAVGANPDDIELLCAGTLAVYAQRGDHVAICYLTNGDKGSLECSPGEMATIRRREAQDSARVIGADLFPLEIPDGEVEVSLPLRRRVVGVIRQAQPDVIITHDRHDYMSDHNSTSRLVFDAAFWAMAGGFAGDPEEAPPASVSPPIFYMDTVGGIGFVPEEYVDISGVIDIKIEMLSQHKSQIAFMRERDGFDLIDYVRTSAKYRGYQCGVPYAEGFVPERVYPSVRPRRLLP